MNEYIVYTMRLTRFLQEKGFQFLRTIPDTTRQDFRNWVFEDTPALRAAVQQYLVSKK